ncbi:Fic family protein [Alcaligenes faecalis]|uniref:Fic family protein n=1 Tax=Alcaligenes faecalis TaxID=511 RepID=UPI0029330EA4|nr:Fic family protein [Alcaligenes faecalis]MDV2116270.1 Fic family protein [Alcaligenes faecalis]
MGHVEKNTTFRHVPKICLPLVHIRRFEAIHPFSDGNGRTGRIPNLVEQGIAQRQTASKILKDLVALKILNEVTVGREKVFINLGLMALLKGDNAR